MPNYATTEIFGLLADQIVTLEAPVSEMRQDVTVPILTATRAVIGGRPQRAVKCSPTIAVDGIDGEAGMAVVQLFHSLLRQKLTDIDMSMTH